MTYNEAIDAIVSRSEALAEISRHPTGAGTDADIAAFLADMGDEPDYSGMDVLGWLGY